MNKPVIIINHDDVFGPKIHPVAGVILKREITPARAFDEFRVAATIWLGYMDARHQRMALDFVGKQQIGTLQ